MARHAAACGGKHLARWFPRALPIPALLMIAFILLTSDRVWVARTLTRTGNIGSTYGTLSIFASLLLLGLYFLAPQLASWAGLSRGVRTPTTDETGRATGLVRLMLLGGLYVVAYGLAHRFLFN
jgi:heme/copper-type cytochrome/quinol oxidase subunit 3